MDAIHKEKILASKRQIHRPYKSKTGKKYADASIKLFSKMKAVPQKVKDEGMKIIVPQGKDFSILWHLKDNGKKSSRNRKVLCSIKENILLKKLSFDFCQTKSGRVCTVCMEGETFSLDKAVGSNVYPSEEKYDPIVEVKKVNDPDIYFTEISKSLTKEDLTSNIIGESQRKIKKNITEIEDRLKIMNFLQPSNLKSSYLSSTDSDKVCKEAEVKVNKCIGILKCDEQDNTFVREINLEEKMNEGNSIIELILERDSIGTDSIQKQYSAHINEGLITTDEDTKGDRLF